jgi:hypothetical protein
MGDTHSALQLRQLPRRRAEPNGWIPAWGRSALIKSTVIASTDARRGSMSNTVEISLEAVLDTANMERAWAGVKANAGSGGVDGKGIAETEAHLK